MAIHPEGRQAGPGPDNTPADTFILPYGRIATIVGVLMVVCTALWGLAAYAEHRALVRTAETERYLQAFESGPVADAWAELSRAWAAERPRQEALLQRFRAHPDTARPVLSNYRHFVFESIAELALEDEISTVLFYFRGLALCIRVGNCDGARAEEYFGDLPWRFRNQHFLYLNEVHADVPFDLDFQTVAPRPREGELRLAGP